MSSADKRTVSTDALETLGTIIGPNEKRDAIHLAVLPVRAYYGLEPGAEIEVIDGWASNPKNGKGMGIVDPFLTKSVVKGEWFWMVLKPRLITSLRHVWTHPAFPSDEVSIEEKSSGSRAQDRLDSIAKEMGVDPTVLINRTKAYLQRGEYWNAGDLFEGASLPDEYWDVYEEVTDTKVDEDDRHNFFSCSC